MVKIRPDEISGIIRQQIEQYKQEIDDLKKVYDCQLNAADSHNMTEKPA